MAADQNFTVTAGGASPNPAAGVDQFDVNDSAGGFFVTRPDANYYVAASLAGVSKIFAVDIVSQTIHGFTVQLTAPLASGDTIRFHVFDAANTGVGRLLATQVLTASSGTYTPTSGTNRVWLRMIGGGGGGGGAGGGLWGAACGGGGASGVFFEQWIDPGAAIVGGSFSVGAGGSAGSNTGLPGGTGSDTSITINSTTRTAKGGTGGGGMQNQTHPTFAGGGLTTSGSSSGDVVLQTPGTAGMFFGRSFWPWLFHLGPRLISGIGGNSPLGAGGPARNSPGAGNAGTGAGAGGSGAAASKTGAAGAAGTAGVIIIYEYS